MTSGKRCCYPNLGAKNKLRKALEQSHLLEGNLTSRGSSFGGNIETESLTTNQGYGLRIGGSK